MLSTLFFSSLDSQGLQFQLITQTRDYCALVKPTPCFCFLPLFKQRPHTRGRRGGQLGQDAPRQLGSDPASWLDDESLSSHLPRLVKEKETHPKELVSRSLNDAKIFGAEHEKRASPVLS